jgi:hypothetical protein
MGTQGRKLRHWRTLWISALCLLCGVAVAQDSPATPSDQSKSIADVARAAHAQKTTKAAKVFTDEDNGFRKNPLPQLSLDGDDNFEDVLDAVMKYRETHTPEEVEKAVHDWYDETDALLASAIHDSIESKDLRQSNITNGYEMCQSGGDYEQCEKRRRAEARGARLDAMRVQQDGQRIGRIQQDFMKIRAGLQRNQLRYAWFKVRNANGVGTF